MERLKNLWRIIKKCHLEKIFVFYFICFYAASFIVWRVDPAFNTFKDATWYFFVASTSIGFGDETVTTSIGRALTVFITYYQLFLFAALSGVLVSHYLDILQKKERQDAIKDRLQNKNTGEVVQQLSIAMHKISGRLNYISNIIDGKKASSLSSAGAFSDAATAAVETAAPSNPATSGEMSTSSASATSGETSTSGSPATSGETPAPGETAISPPAASDADSLFAADVLSSTVPLDQLTIVEILYKLQHLTDLNPEELKELQDRFKISLK